MSKRFIAHAYDCSGQQLPQRPFSAEATRSPLFAQLHAAFGAHLLETREAVGERAFAMQAEGPLSPERVVFQFKWAGRGSGYVAWAREAGGKPTKLEGITVLLSGLEPDTEANLLDKIQAHASMAPLGALPFNFAKKYSEPLSITFFVTEDAPADELIHALVGLTAHAFFSLLGIAHPGTTKAMRFKGLIAWPDSVIHPVQLREAVLELGNSSDIYEQFKKALLQTPAGFKTVLGFGGDDLTLNYHKHGATTGMAVWTFEKNGEIKHMHGFTALLPKLDAADDRTAIDEIRQAASMQGIAPEAFDNAIAEPDPVVATFFADHGSAGYPILHSVIKILSAAFFDQFGIGSEE